MAKINEDNQDNGRFYEGIYICKNIEKILLNYFHNVSCHTWAVSVHPVVIQKPHIIATRN